MPQHPGNLKDSSHELNKGTKAGFRMDGTGLGKTYSAG
ncbi:hypothetical protein AVEN_13670-1, partial [Araneus ventricosus]